MRLAGLVVLAAVSLCLPDAAPAREVPLPLLAMRDRAPSEIKAGQAIKLDALARYSYEELRLFHSDRGEQLDLIYPYCISANAAGLDYPDRQALDGKWVRVGFRNDCFGPYVVRIETIEEIDPAPYAPRDCVARTFNFCIPREYDDYWLFSGMLLRQPAPRLGGPVTIRVEAVDNFSEQPVSGMFRRELGDYIVFYDLVCESETSCRLTTAPTARYGLDYAESRGLIHRYIQIAAESKTAMEEALTKVRYCPVGECEGGPSISLADLAAGG